MGDLAAICITNANHVRASADFSSSSPVYARAEVAAEFPSAITLRDGESLHGLEVISVDGAAPGEMALYDARFGGSVIIGDALINFEPHGFALLPAKYCTDRKRMVHSLQRLLLLPFTRLFFAHGFPVVTSAHARLAALLRANS